MSISSHLTNEPERRLRIILEDMTESADRSDRKIAVLTALAAAGAALAVLALPESTRRLAALLPLAAALPLGVLGFSPLRGLAGWYSFLDAPAGKSDPLECLPMVDSLAKYSHRELINRLDKYLGGGIERTSFYEDLVAQIVLSARTAFRKQRLFRVLCALVGGGQLALGCLLISS